MSESISSSTRTDLQFPEPTCMSCSPLPSPARFWVAAAPLRPSSFSTAAPSHSGIWELSIVTEDPDVWRPLVPPCERWVSHLHPPPAQAPHPQSDLGWVLDGAAAPSCASGRGTLPPPARSPEPYHRAGQGSHRPQEGCRDRSSGPGHFWFGQGAILAPASRGPPLWHWGWTSVCWQQLVAVVWKWWSAPLPQLHVWKLVHCEV